MCDIQGVSSRAAVMGLKDSSNLEVGAWASQAELVVKNPPANAGDIRDVASIPESGRSPGGGHSNPLQYSFLENLMNRGAWRAIVHRVAKSWTWLRQLSTQRLELSLLQKQHVSGMSGWNQVSWGRGEQTSDGGWLLQALKAEMTCLVFALRALGSHGPSPGSGECPWNIKGF